MAARKQASHIDMNNLLVKNLGAPVDPNDAARKAYVDAQYTAGLARGNHTGTQTAATISDFTAEVRKNKVTDLAAPTSALSMNNQKVTGLAAPTTATDASTKQYADDGDTAARARGNHTGTQTASTISDFATEVRKNTLNQMAAPTAAVPMAGQKITGLAAGTATGDAVRWDELQSTSTADRSRANHTGTQAASTISDFVATVRAVRLDQMAAPAAPVPMGGQKITGLAAPTAGTDAANKDYVDGAVTASASGLVLKGSVAAATQDGINISAPGASIDGTPMVAGEKFIRNSLITPANNGVWIWNGAAVAATRDPLVDTAAELVPGSFWIVLRGAVNADKLAVFTNDTPPTVGTSGLYFNFMGGLPGGLVRTTARAVPAVAAGASVQITSFPINVIASVRVTDSVTAMPVDVAYSTSDDVITLYPDVALANQELTVTVTGTLD
jgi:hypothetical protein